jgi:hypothetical protein
MLDLPTFSFPRQKEPQQDGGPLTTKLRYRRLLRCACRTGLPSLVRLVLKAELSCCSVGRRTRDRITAATLKYHAHFASLLAIDVIGFWFCSYRLWANSEIVNFIILSSLLIAQLLVFWHIAVELYIPKIGESGPPLQMAALSGSVPVVQALLDAGEDQCWPLYDPEVSLFEAVMRNNTDMVQYLLDNCFYRSIQTRWVERLSVRDYAKGVVTSSLKSLAFCFVHRLVFVQRQSTMRRIG